MYGDGNTNCSIIFDEANVVGQRGEETTLEEYATRMAISTAMIGSEVVSLETEVNAQGLPVAILKVAHPSPEGLLIINHLLYIHEGRMSYRVLYLVPEPIYPEMEPVIKFSISTFRVEEPL